MSLTSDPSKIPYEIRPEFEPQVARLLCLSEDFWERCGRFLDPELLGSKCAKLVGKAAAELCKDGAHPGRSGSGLERVVQRIQRWSTEDGRIPRADVQACYEYLISAPDLPVSEAVSELAPTLRRQLEMRLSRETSNLHMAEDRDKARDVVRQTLDAIDQVGKTRHKGVLFGPLSGTDIHSALTIARLRRIPFGIPELDAIMGGGPQIGRLGAVPTYAGHGKSMMGNHHACNAARNGEFAIYFTGEMLHGDQSLRMLSNLTSVPTKAMVAEERWAEEARIRYEWLVEHKQIVPPVIHRFASTVTKVHELTEVAEEYERRAGRRAALLVYDADEHIDYTKVDFPGLEQLVKKSDPGTYEGFGRLYAYLSWLAKGGQENPADSPELARAIDVLSQVKGEPNPARFKILSGEEMADSKRKIRIVDWCVTINYKQAERGNVFYVAKGRHDGAWESTPALPRAWECAQMVAVADPYPWVQDPTGWRRRQKEFWR